MFVHDTVREDFLNRTLLLADSGSQTALAQLIDHTLLKLSAQEDEFLQLVRESSILHFRSVCIPPSRIQSAADFFAQFSTKKEVFHKICTVIGFPNGYSLTASKCEEVIATRKLGACEFDYVQNIGLAREHKWAALECEAADIVRAAGGDVVKVILETSLLNDEEIYRSALAAARAGVHYLKTSTGFGTRGASINDMTLLSRAADQWMAESGKRIGIKASGGIRTASDALEMLKHGACRLGTSCGPVLLAGSAHSATGEY